MISIPMLGINGNCIESNFNEGLGKLLHRCCIRGVNCNTPMGMPTTKHCEFFDGLNMKMDGVIGGIRKVFGNANSEILKVRIIENNTNHNRTVINRSELNPVWGKIGFIRCEDKMFLAHFTDTGTKRTWFVFNNNGGRQEIAQCNIN